MIHEMHDVTDDPVLLLDQGGIQQAQNSVNGAAVVMIIIGFINVMMLTALIFVYSRTPNNQNIDDDEQDVNDNYPTKYEEPRPVISYVVPQPTVTDAVSKEYKPKVTKDTYVRQNVSSMPQLDSPQSSCKSVIPIQDEDSFSEQTPQPSTLDVSHFMWDKIGQVMDEAQDTTNSVSLDDIRVYGYEGSGSGVGSLSSLGSELNETDYDIVELARGLGKLAFIYRYEQSESD